MTMSRRAIEDCPEVMRMADIAAWLGISLKRAYALEGEGAFLFAQHRPTLGRKSWSRERFKQWDRGELQGLTGQRKGRVA